MRELKRMQREESRQQQELESRAALMRENQEKKFLIEKQVNLEFETEYQACLLRQF